MSRITIIAIASWSAALVAAGAFAYVLSADAPQPVAGAMNWAQKLATPEVTSHGAAMHHEAASFVVLPPTVITSDRRPASSLPQLAPAARSLSEMNCSGWRPLEQGSRGQMVRSCE